MTRFVRSTLSDDLLKVYHWMCLIFKHVRCICSAAAATSQLKKLLLSNSWMTVGYNDMVLFVLGKAVLVKTDWCRCCWCVWSLFSLLLGRGKNITNTHTRHYRRGGALVMNQNLGESETDGPPPSPFDHPVSLSGVGWNNKQKMSGVEEPEEKGGERDWWRWGNMAGDVRLLSTWSGNGFS